MMSTSALYICFLGKYLMASSDELCGTGDMLILKIEAKLHQTLLKRRDKFDTVIHCQTKRSTREGMWWEMKKRKEIKTKTTKPTPKWGMQQTSLLVLIRTSYFPSFCCWLFLCKFVYHQDILCGSIFPEVSWLEEFSTPVDNMVRKRSGNVACPACPQQN